MHKESTGARCQWHTWPSTMTTMISMIKMTMMKKMLKCCASIPTRSQRSHAHFVGSVLLGARSELASVRVDRRPRTSVSNTSSIASSLLNSEIERDESTCGETLVSGVTPAFMNALRIA